MLTVSGLKRFHISASFDLQDGECVALQGPSGVGKTLLLRSIADLDPNEGTVKLDGTLRETMPAPVWRKRVTYLAAEPGWWSETVQEHFSCWDDAVPLVTRLGLSSDCASWPIQRLSTGERQRLGIARALIRNSPVLILDEPTAALDSEAEERVIEALERLMKGRTVVMIAHRLATLRSADKLIVLKDGSVTEEGTHEHLLSLGGVYTGLHDTQEGAVGAEAAG